MDVRHEKTDLTVFVVVIPEEGWACMAALFFEFKSFGFIDHVLQKSVSYQKTHAHPSFGTTTTKTLRSVFLWRAFIVVNSYTQ